MTAREILRSITSPRGPNVPDKERRARKPFTIVIELDAVMDSMTMLRGMTAHGRMYDTFTSDEITRFPSFDTSSGTEWKLPEPFATFFDKAVNQHDYFSRVRPYDFAKREIIFLQRKGVQLIFHVPSHMEKHKTEIESWSNRLFPKTNSVEPIKFTYGDPSEIKVDPNIWLVRSPGFAKFLKAKKQPFILFDGKENARIRSGVRVVRWDQAGYALRLAEDIFRGDHPVAGSHKSTKPVKGEQIPPTEDIWGGHIYFPPDVSRAVVWVGDQIESLEHVKSNPDKRLLYGNDAGEKAGRPLEPSQKRNALAAISADLRELERKQKVLELAAATRTELILARPKWARFILNRDFDMNVALRDIKPEVEIEPSTHITDRLEVGNTDPEIPLQLTVPDYLHLAGENWDALQKEELKGDGKNRAGAVAEMMTVLMLKQEGWKVFLPRQDVNGRPGSLQNFTRVKIDWIPQHGPQKVRETEVDCLAQAPNGQYYILEVKVSSQTRLSKEQRALKDHLDNGGAILNPNCVGIDKRTPKIYPRHRVITFDRLELDPTDAINPSAQTPANLSR